MLIIIVDAKYFKPYHKHMKKSALITGILGQDGPYLARLLIEKGYNVYGMLRRHSNHNFDNTDFLGITSQINFVQGDLCDETSIRNLVQRLRPNEIYNLGAQSFVGLSWDQINFTTQVNAFGTLAFLQAIRDYSPMTKFYQASTSEMYGDVSGNKKQNEETSFKPQNPYAIAKLYSYWMTNNFKTSYGLFATNGILFNHESPIRGKEFVTRKITDGIAQIKLGLKDSLSLGNLDSKRDWGFAGDYVEAMWLIMQHKNPDNFVIATGETHSIKDFLNIAFDHVGIKNWKNFVKIDPRFKRPTETSHLHGDSSKARKQLGWKPKVNLEQLVKMMLDADLKRYSDLKSS